jgi:hypothetical protein
MAEAAGETVMPLKGHKNSDGSTKTIFTHSLPLRATIVVKTQEKLLVFRTIMVVSQLPGPVLRIFKFLQTRE